MGEILKVGVCLNDEGMLNVDQYLLLGLNVSFEVILDDYFLVDFL